MVYIKDSKAEVSLTIKNNKAMTIKVFNKWIKVLEKAENKNKQLLEEKKISPDGYILLNKINADKYEMIVKQYHQELV